ncbi:hypothetical protein AO1008_06905 [Aspergillus oryzae 100-8]|nr:hypothetical protein AO1008_06905 [Aspergillus oryzae 100-8]
MKDSKGWDGKLRVGPQATITNPEAIEDPDYSDEDAPPVEEIEADEGMCSTKYEIDLVHCRIGSIPALHLERFPKVQVRYRCSVKESGGLVIKIRINGEVSREYNKISKIEGLEGLKVLRNLELGANRIRVGGNLDALQNLKILSIQSNRLTSLNGLSSLKNLEELYVSHNAITELSGLESNTKLRVLDFSNNQVSKLEHLSHLENLEELWGSNNQLSSFDEVEKELKDKEKLQTVYFEGNPLQTKGPAVYRNKVRLAIPHIMQIDASTAWSTVRKELRYH